LPAPVEHRIQKFTVHRPLQIVVAIQKITISLAAVFHQPLPKIP
jgi:hypothetical protein